MNECELNSDVESSRVCGVYRITNTINGKVYLGSSTDPKERFRDHRARLNGGGHDNPHLQNSWRKYGAEAFRFEIVERCAPEMLEERETHWIMELGSHNDENGYNWSPWASKMHAKLSPNDVREMRRLRREEGTTYRELGEMFGVSQSAASRAVRGDAWADVEGAATGTHGRSRPGGANSGAVLTDKQVLMIREAVTSGSVKRFAGELGVSRSLIKRAISGDTYPHLPGATSFCPRLSDLGRCRRINPLPIGESHHKAKLTNEKVRAMRRRRRSTLEPYARIGAAYGVTKRTARRAIQGDTWKHVQDVPPVMVGEGG